MILLEAIIPTLPAAMQHVTWTIFALMACYSSFNAIAWVRGR